MTRKTEARELLASMIAPTTAAIARTTPNDAIDAAIHEALLNQPSLRHCIVPGCLREYDALSTMAGDPPPRPEWSGAGWATLGSGSIFPAGGHICPDHKQIVTDHLPRRVKLPNDRWTVDCACGWMPTPQTWHGLLRAQWEQHLLTVTGVLHEPPAASEPGERIPLAEHTEETLKDLYDALDDTDYDRAETRETAQAIYKSWDWHRHALAGVARAVNTVCNMMRTSADFTDHRDWTADRIDAFLWAVLIGWDDDQLATTADKHQWNEHRVKYIREMHGLLAPTRDPQSPVETNVDPRQASYDAVFAYIRQQPRDFLPTTVVDRNAMIWHAVHAALDAVGLPETQKPKENL